MEFEPSERSTLTNKQKKDQKKKPKQRSGGEGGGGGGEEEKIKRKRKSYVAELKRFKLHYYSVTKGFEEREG